MGQLTARHGQDSTAQFVDQGGKGGVSFVPRKQGEERVCSRH